VNKLQHKLGPLKLWQWIAIGVALGGGILIYRKTHPTTSEEPSGELFGGTGTGAYGPIDPNTGIPYSFEGAGAAGGGSEGNAAGEIASWISTLKELGLWPEGGEAGEAPPADVIAAGKHTQKARAKQAKHKAAKPRHPATSTGAGAAAGGHSHTAPPHPGTRIGIGAAHPAAPLPGTGSLTAGPGSASGGVIHPQAVSLGIGVGQPKPSAPAGWHVYKGANGQWWRAPNA
jgi:hypothetical protein